MADWYWMKNGEKHGPVDTAHLKQLARTRQLEPTDTIWREGLPEWVPARKAKGLFPAESSHPSPPSSPPVRPPRSAAEDSDKTTTGQSIGVHAGETPRPSIPPEAETKESPPVPVERDLPTKQASSPNADGAETISQASERHDKVDSDKTGLVSSTWVPRIDTAAAIAIPASTVAIFTLEALRESGLMPGASMEWVLDFLTRLAGVMLCASIAFCFWYARKLVLAGRCVAYANYNDLVISVLAIPVAIVVYIALALPMSVVFGSAIPDILQTISLSIAFVGVFAYVVLYGSVPNRCFGSRTIAVILAVRILIAFVVAIVVAIALYHIFRTKNSDGTRREFGGKLLDFLVGFGFLLSVKEGIDYLALLVTEQKFRPWSEYLRFNAFPSDEVIVAAGERIMLMFNENEASPFPST